MMIITGSLVDKALNAALDTLKQAGVSFDADEYGILHERLTDFLTDDCEIKIQETVTFDDLQGDQWMSWMALARQAQEDRGENIESITSEETEQQAEQLFTLHNGELPPTAYEDSPGTTTPTSLQATDIQAGAITITCPNCHNTVDCDRDPRGTHVQCDDCNHTIAVSTTAEITLD
ncbi:hypothetical protein [Aliagarivorans taiwanensis]|uniref:hypothetical protein n=1 Tax=Aliagarivorans taiwanensis TaxID=561966 RepID=UPI00042885CA|nr:hypothetical protein [Aliagarivorans taiwanensis]